MNLQNALKLKTELDALRPFSKEDEERIMQKFRLDWNYHSNHLEGNSLTYGETKALILFGITAQGKPLKDHFEISGHDEAIKWILDIIKENRPLTENFIRELHQLILKEPYEINTIKPDGKPSKKLIKIGEYKTTPNHVKTKTGEIFRFATPEETPAMIKGLIDWFRDKTSATDCNPILIAAEFHYKFIRIHPFDDGNGRTARILMNFIFLQFGYPPVVIKTEDKENYFAVLRLADAGNLTPFVEYITENLIHSLEIMIKGAKGESVEEPDDIDKEISLLEQKFESFSKPIDLNKRKSIEIVLDIFEASIEPLLYLFIEKAEKMEKFYIENNFSLFISDNFCTSNRKRTIELLKRWMRENIDSIELVFNYKALNQKKLDSFDYQSSIKIEFTLTEYQIINSKEELILSKMYDEQLTEKEISLVVNTEIRNHTKAIEEAITKLYFI